VQNTGPICFGKRKKRPAPNPTIIFFLIPLAEAKPIHLLIISKLNYGQDAVFPRSGKQSIEQSKEASGLILFVDFFRPAQIS